MLSKRYLSNNKVNVEIKTPYLLGIITFYANEEVHSGKVSSSPVSSGEQKKKDDTNDTSNNEVTPIYHYPYEYNDNPGMGDKYKCKMAPQLIMSSVKPKTQDELPIEELTSSLPS